MGVIKKTEKIWTLNTKLWTQRMSWCILLDYFFYKYSKCKLPIGDVLIQIITMDATYLSSFFLFFSIGGYPINFIYTSLMVEEYYGYILWQQDNNKKEKKKEQGEKSKHHPTQLEPIKAASYVQPLTYNN